MEDNHQWKDGARIAILPTVILCLISAFSDLQDRYPDQDDGDQTHEDQDEISGEFHGSLEKRAQIRKPSCCSFPDSIALRILTAL